MQRLMRSRGDCVTVQAEADIRQPCAATASSMAAAQVWSLVLFFISMPVWVIATLLLLCY
jgi:hypothetical protein